MSDDDQLTSWMGKPESGIRRAGELNETEVAEATVSYLKNGTDLLFDARFLIANARFSRGAALVVLGLEELAKIKIIVETFLNMSMELIEMRGSYIGRQEEIIKASKNRYCHTERWFEILTMATQYMAVTSIVFMHRMMRSKDSIGSSSPIFM